MKKVTLAAILLVLALALFLTACGSDDNDSISEPPEPTWANSDWDLMFIGTDEAFDAKTSMFSISAIWLGDTSGVAEGDSASVVIDGTYYTLDSFWGMPTMYWGVANLNPGQTYTVKFMHNGTLKAETSVQMPYFCDGTFPEMYYPSQSNSFNWTLSNNNQYQYAGVSSYDSIDEQEDDYIKFIQPGDRSYTTPANAVDNFGSDTVYDLIVGQLTYKRANRISFTAFQADAEYYGEGKGPLDELAKIMRARKILNALKASM